MTTEFSREAPEQKNGLGLAGMIVSIAALVLTCGLLCPIGLIMSLFALKKEPKGMAIAGAVIGGIGTLFGVLVGVSVVMGFLFVKKGIEEGGGDLGTTFAIVGATTLIDQDRVEKGSLPDAAAGTAIIAGITDTWGRPLRYEPQGEGYTIRSAGKDGAFDTSDDVTQSK